MFFHNVEKFHYNKDEKIFSAFASDLQDQFGNEISITNPRTNVTKKFTFCKKVYNNDGDIQQFEYIQNENKWKLIIFND